jgi:hypothetical protein
MYYPARVARVFYLPYGLRFALLRYALHLARPDYLNRLSKQLRET